MTSRESVADPVAALRKQHVPPLRLRPHDLRPGDHVHVDGRWLQVAGEPVTVHSGWSLFDDFRIAVGVPVALPGQNARRQLRRWAPDEWVDVRRCEVDDRRG
jgi:hypothetical protein